MKTVPPTRDAKGDRVHLVTAFRSVAELHAVPTGLISETGEPVYADTALCGRATATLRNTGADFLAMAENASPAGDLHRECVRAVSPR